MQPNTMLPEGQDSSEADNHLACPSFAELITSVLGHIGDTYALERKVQQHAAQSEQSAHQNHSLRVLFRVPSEDAVQCDALGPSGAQPATLGFADDMAKQLSALVAECDVGCVPAGLIKCTSRYLQRACMLLRGAENGLKGCQAVSRGSHSGVGHHSSSSGIDVSACDDDGRLAQQCKIRKPTVESVSRSFPLAYSSEDGTSLMSGDYHTGDAVRGERSYAGSLHEAEMAFCCLIGIAFSCPCQSLANCLQLIIADVLGKAICPSSLRGRILKCLSQVDARTIRETQVSELWGMESNANFLYVMEGKLVRLNWHEVLSPRLHEATDVKWYVAPSPTAALPTLGQLLSGRLSRELDALQKSVSTAGTMPRCSLPSSSSTPSLTRRRLGTLSKGRTSSCGAIDGELANKEASKEKDATQQALWEALSHCSIASLRSLCSGRRDLLYRIFTDMGELPQYYYVLSACPEFLKAHHSTFIYVFFGNGPLLNSERLMVAFMTACRQKCEYLVCRFGALLMRVGGKEGGVCGAARSWLRDGPPPKLQALQRFIAIATHVPWQISDVDIRTAMSAGWSIHGLMQVSTIVAETLSLCSLVMGLFVPNDLCSFTALPPALAALLSPCVVVGDEHHHNADISFTRYTGVDDIVSEKRIKGSNVGGSTLRSGNFNWQEHGSTLMEQYYPGAASLINDEFDALAGVVRRLNHSDCVGLTSPEYSPAYAFQSLLLYVQNIIGFMSDNYPYNDINKVLRRQAKLIAQTCTMHPETLSGAQLRLWMQPAVEGSTSTGDFSSSQVLSGDTRRRMAAERRAEDQKQELIESLNRHRAPFTLSLPGDSTEHCGRPEDDVVEEALRLHEEWLVLVLLLCTMKARKEGLMTLLLYPMWKILNNM
ncbi:PA26 p53-induced protein (sestrin) [Trypanosoma brucei equiperdum]|uniref:PA26 p53-induced protein (Sestrin) n=1 Tax=Trypanosoma brucei equiperdum TaxID=630700 RepID=A0A3L6L017_9TRYP|nr:PA26 p53-induced protein (sestrin) [Trypanosoma brucei equiperdum]